jgi:hypothetical protein
MMFICFHIAFFPFGDITFQIIPISTLEAMTSYLFYGSITQTLQTQHNGQALPLLLAIVTKENGEAMHGFLRAEQRD